MWQSDFRKGGENPALRRAARVVERGTQTSHPVTKRRRQNGAPSNCGHPHIAKCRSLHSAPCERSGRDDKSDSGWRIEGEAEFFAERDELGEPCLGV